jgi:endonuclease III related protein
VEAAVERQSFTLVKPSQPKAKKRPVRRGAEEQVRQIYRTLAQTWGAQHWWPAETPLEVIVGAILTQNTSWTNVERAMAKLREAGVLSLAGIRNVPLAELELLIRSSGYFRQKAQRLKDFVAFVDAKYGGSLTQMFATPSDELRAELLTQKGIGMETADSILLYAGLHSVFVVDAYTRRVFERHGMVNASVKYDEIRLLVEHALAEEEVPDRALDIDAASRPAVHPPSTMSTAQQANRTRVYNEMHGLLVQAGKHYCDKRRPKCETCPLGGMLSPRQRARLQAAGREINRLVTEKADQNREPEL